MARWTGGPCEASFLSVRYQHWLMNDSIETTSVTECVAWQENLVYQ